MTDNINPETGQPWTLVEICNKARKLMGRQLVQDHSFTPWGGDMEGDTRAWQLGHKMLGTPGFEDVLEDGSRKSNDEPK